MRVAACFDLLAEIVCATPDELRDFLDTHCYGSMDIVSVEPMVGLGLYKSLLKWDKPLVAGQGLKNSREPATGKRQKAGTRGRGQT